MKRLYLLFISIIAAITLLACGEAETIIPGDYQDPFSGGQIGGVTTMTASVSIPTFANPVIIIDFDTPVAAESIKYDTTSPTIQVAIRNGAIGPYTTIPLNSVSEPNGYYADPKNLTPKDKFNSISINLNPQKTIAPIVVGTWVRITLTDGLTAYGGYQKTDGTYINPTLSNPGNFERQVQP